MDQTQVVAKININYENVQQSLPNLRLEESKIAAELQRNSINLDNQGKEIERANTAVEEIQIRIEQIKNDSNREQFLFDERVEPIITPEFVEYYFDLLVDREIEEEWKFHFGRRNYIE